MSNSNSSSSEDDPEIEALNYIEKFYDRNYRCYELMKEKDYTNMKVWNVFYDEIYDLAYIFVANYNRKKKKDKVNVN